MGHARLSSRMMTDSDLEGTWSGRSSLISLSLAEMETSFFLDFLNFVDAIAANVINLT
jgi:hypothetical protein